MLNKETNGSEYFFFKLKVNNLMEIKMSLRRLLVKELKKDQTEKNLREYVIFNKCETFFMFINILLLFVFHLTI
jgi:uncharacterized membrane protein